MKLVIFAFSKFHISNGLCVLNDWVQSKVMRALAV